MSIECIYYYSLLRDQKYVYVVSLEVTSTNGQRRKGLGTHRSTNKDCTAQKPCTQWLGNIPMLYGNQLNC